MTKLLALNPSRLTKTAKDGAPAASNCPACGKTGGQVVLEAPDRFHGRSEKYRLVRCSFCSLVRTDNAPPPAEIGEHYGVQYDLSVSQAGEDPRRWQDRCERLQQLLPGGGSVLDLGCSAGGFLASLKGASWRRYGIEMSELAANAARRRCGADVFVGDILDAPFSDSSFDAITCFHVFEHMYQPRGILERVSRWLKPGGIFFAMMPNIDSAGAKIFRSYWYALELPRHIGHWSPESLAALATSVGLETVALDTHHELFIESSVRYIVDEMLRRAGIARVPLALANPPGLPFRVVRKAFRLTILPILTGLGSLAGDGESIHAVFRKPALDQIRSNQRFS